MQEYDTSDVLNESSTKTCPARFYSEWQGEEHRLFTVPSGIIERLRTHRILNRFLPKPPALIYDIGGGAGVYAFPLAEQGYHVHLIDLTERHIALASDHMAESGIQLSECAVGDARKIEAPADCADAVLLLGPLYHTKTTEDRHRILRESRRILKPGGVLFAAAISRYAVYHDFGQLNQLDDPHIAALSKDVLETGQNRQPCDHERNFFSYSAYFHHPDELEQEVADAGFSHVEMLSVEGASWLFSGLGDIVKNEQSIQNLLHFIEQTETERSTMGASGHIMAVARK